jgi:hypothetical protein
MNGEWLIVQHVGPGDLALGDIGMFWVGGALLVHRVISIDHHDEKFHFLLKGDSSVETQSLSEEDLFGKVVEIHGRDHKTRLESPLWRRTHAVIGHYLRWSCLCALALKKAEHRILGGHLRPFRFLPSRLFLFGCGLLPRALVGLLYLFRGRLVNGGTPAAP